MVNTRLPSIYRRFLSDYSDFLNDQLNDCVPRANDSICITLGEVTSYTNVRVVKRDPLFSRVANLTTMESLIYYVLLDLQDWKIVAHDDSCVKLQHRNWDNRNNMYEYDHEEIIEGLEFVRILVRAIFSLYDDSLDIYGMNQAESPLVISEWKEEFENPMYLSPIYPGEYTDQTPVYHEYSLDRITDRITATEIIQTVYGYYREHLWITHEGDMVYDQEGRHAWQAHRRDDGSEYVFPMHIFS